MFQPTSSASTHLASIKPTGILPRRELREGSTSQPSTVLANSQVPKSIPGKRTATLRRAISSYHGKKLSKRELLIIVTQMSIMLRSGVDLADAVRSIHLRSSNKSIAEALGDVYASLENGDCLSAALESQRHRFGGVMVASVAAGEASGRLTEVLSRFGVILRDELRLQSSLRSVLAYPFVLFLVTGMVLAAMIFFVLPQFSGIYASSRAPTPALTRLLLDASSVARNYWWLVVSGVAIFAATAVGQLRSRGGKQRIDTLLLTLPYVSSIANALLAGRMFRLQGAMLGSGVPILEVLDLTRHSLGNSCYQALIDDIDESVTNGKGVADALEGSICIPEGAIEMIAIAEANGQLASVLQTIGEFYESEGEQKLRDAVKLAEPTIIVVLGVIVGAVVLAVMLPLLDLSTAGGQ